MEDILARGASLERMSDMSTSLRDESLKYRRAARRARLPTLLSFWQ
jgi:vesicle transport protein SEC22